ncbi:E3 ubiquitin-protein ligase SH3RF1 [Anopheles aquasalis]|uniref:E3 ubiquitin-protein ligase SH3RF1 n=1 Tax=Anopheles aquasalis TaxID=42839 RepID=UPI00215B4FD2|nr:E3 ubiquitin-protein ligase SH3RF1 [Anopheles aquasalis]
MDERLLNDLLECSVCLERLDSSSKVLPCQHTFCRKCLEEIVASHQELRCPECRVLVEVRIDELPPNVLLMRILEGMKTAELNNQNNASNKPTCNRNPSHGANHGNAATNPNAGYQQQQQQGYPGQQHPSSGAKIGKSLVPGVASGPESQQQQQQQLNHQQQGQPHPHQQQHHQHHHHHQPLSRIIASNSPSAAATTTTTTTTTSTTNATSNSAQQLPDLSKIPHAKAFYDFSSSETSDISFRKGDIILLKKKIDHNWCVGEVNGKLGAVPLNHIKVLVPLPFPQCKALYDFRMGPTEEEGCLTFKKGAIIHVLRRVDQNWAEGRIADKIGIFPISFVEMNGLAKQLMDSSLKHLLGNNSSNRSVPPTPFDLNASATSSSDTSSSVTTSPNSSTSTTSSNSSTAPSSPTAHFLQSPPPPPSAVAPPSGAAAAKSSQNHNPLHNHPPQHHHHQHQRSDPGNREKRHSLTTATLAAINSAGGAAVPGSSGALQPQSQPVPSHRHSSEMLNHDGGPSDGSAAVAAAAAYQKCNLTKASQMYQQHPQLPATYVALYPYKPQKPDELELKKGSIYYVTERCQDGWFKGSNWQKKSGVFPGNYVTIHKGREGGTSGGRTPNTAQHPSGKLNNAAASPSASVAANGSNASSASAAAMHSVGSNGTNGSSPHQHQHQPLQLPELPPRNTTQPQQGLKYIDSIFGRQTSHDGGGGGGGGGSPSNEPSSTESTPPGGTTTPATASSTGKVKKDSSAVSLMKRLTNMKRSKSPTSSGATVTAAGGCSGGTTNPAYTSDSSLFDESTAQLAKPNFQQIVNPVHVRSGSCPSQLLQNLPMDLMVGSVQQHPHQTLLQHQQLNLGSGIAAAPPMYGSQRIKPHKERPSMMHGFKYGEQHGGGAGMIVTATKHNTIAHEAPASTSHHAAKQQTQIYHRKSQSLDASAIIGQIGPSTSSQQQHGPAALGGSVTSSTDRLVAGGPAIGLANGGTPSKSASSSSKSSSSHSQSVRERFKCIVPYPPNSEYELELRVGDIVMVHKKRDNGWYKGTHARSGKTGLFPASFVEPDI